MPDANRQSQQSHIPQLTSSSSEQPSLLEQVLATLPEALLLIDRDWRILWANPLAMRLSRLSEASFGRDHWELYPETLGTEIETTYRRAMRDRTHEHLEFFYPPFDCWYKLVIVPLANGGLAFHYHDVSEAKILQQAAEELNHQLQQVFAAVPDAVLVIDNSWTFTFANQRCLDLLGVGTLVGKNLFELFPGNREEPFFSSYNRTMTERVPTEFEAFYPAPLNLWFQILARPYNNNSIILFFTDISPRKHAELARDQVLEITDDGVVALDRGFRFTYLNRRAREILSVREKELLGEIVFEIFPEAAGSIFEENYRTSMEGVPTSFTAFYGAPLYVWAEIDCRPTDDGILIFFRDITARKAAEETRDRTLAQLHQVFDATADGVISLDRAWKILFLNRRAQELLSPSGQIIGKQFWETFPNAIYPDSPFVEIYHRAMEERLVGQFEAFYPAPLNLYFEVHARPSAEGIVIFFRDITERRASEIALREQQDLLASIQTATGVATWELNLRTGTMTYGPGSAAVFGRPLESLRHIDDIREAMHPDFRDRLGPGIVDSITSASPVSHEYRMQPADGRPLWIESRSQAVREGDLATHLRGIAIDITRRKADAEALIASEARYRVLADLNPQALWIGDPQGQIIYANQGFLDYLGLTLDNLDTWLDCFDSTDRNRVLASWLHSVASGQEYDIEACLIGAADGHSRLWHLHGLPVLDDAGAIMQWLGVANDIQEQKTFSETLLRMQGETERERAELESLYKTAPIGLALFDLDDFHYIRLNDRQAAFFNLRPDEILGRTVTELAPIPGLREMFEGVAGGTPVINHLLEGELPSHPGEHRFWTVSYFPVYGSNGQVTAISAATLEITQQKKAEAALVQSEKLAAVGRLASSISHEINNPLEAITNLLYLAAMNENLPEDIAAYIHMAQSELARVSQIATQTLRFHRQAVSPTHVTAAQLVGAVLNLYQGRLNNSAISVSAQYASTTPILCFENDIRQVLNNLIANAIDAMRSGGRLLARAHNTTDLVTGVPGVRITVADTGHGMSPATLLRIFEPFYTTKDLNGTGLGLWISAGIVERHGGRLSVRSSEHPVHHGTIFSLLLPIYPSGLASPSMLAEEQSDTPPATLSPVSDHTTEANTPTNALHA